MKKDKMSGAWIAAVCVLAVSTLVFLALWLWQGVFAGKVAWRMEMSPCRDAEGREVTCGPGTRTLSFVCPRPGLCKGLPPESTTIDCAATKTCRWQQT